MISPVGPLVVLTEDSLLKVIKTSSLHKIGVRTDIISAFVELMDKQYGDYLNIWHELTVPSNKNIDRMIGDVKELVELENGKESYKLFIPLRFWFNRITGLALPVVSLQYNHIKINLEINDLNKCYVIAPTHYINIDNDLVNFKQFEFIEQTVDEVVSIARFIHFDVIDRRLYLWRITDEKFQSLTELDPTKIQTEEDQDLLLYERDPDTGELVNKRFLIKGRDSCFEAMPRINAAERSHRNTSVNFNNIILKEAFLLVEYIFLDLEERVKFSQSKHEYLIEQVLYNGEKTIDGLHQSFQVGFTQPCKELIWVSQLTLAQNLRNNDHFNYTDSVIKDANGDPIGNNIIREETILFNGHERISMRDSEYFNWIQPYQYFNNAPIEGINVYSFCLHPIKHQPSGSANLSQIDNILLRLTVNTNIDFSNTAKLRVYGIVYNILRVANGISGLVFSNDIQI
jgi:hypothetical protein